MIIGTYFAGACTTCGIQELGMSLNAFDAMVTFCKQELLGASKFGKDGPLYQKLTAFYVFTAGPEEPGHGHSKRWVKYGTEFAAYIQEHNLGMIVTCPPKLNDKYHPDTTCQTWLWSPDQEALQGWWETVGSTYKKSKQKPGRPKNPNGRDKCPRCERSYYEHYGWNCPDGGVWPEK